MRPRGGIFPSTNKGWAFPLGQATAGSIDFEDLTPQWAYAAGGGHQANTYVDIAGSGVLALVHNASTTTRIFSIQVDGGTIEQINMTATATTAARANGTIVLLLRFTTALKVTCDAATSNQVYIVYATN